MPTTDKRRRYHERKKKRSRKLALKISRRGKIIVDHHSAISRHRLRRRLNISGLVDINICKIASADVWPTLVTYDDTDSPTPTFVADSRETGERETTPFTRILLNGIQVGIACCLICEHRADNYLLCENEGSVSRRLRRILCILS